MFVKNFVKDFKQELKEAREEGKKEGIIEGQVKSLTKYIDNGRITVDEAATSVNMTVEDFLKKRQEIEKKSSF